MSEKLKIFRTYAATLQVVGCVLNAPYRTGRVENAAAISPLKGMAKSRESCVSPMGYQSLSSNLQTLVADALLLHPSKFKKPTAKKTILLLFLFAFDSCLVEGASA